MNLYFKIHVLAQTKYSTANIVAFWQKAPMQKWDINRLFKSIIKISNSKSDAVAILQLMRYFLSQLF